ncbi:MAG: hypothetical protein ABIR15_22455 [Chitinophagaceae bacterium]
MKNKFSALLIIIIIQLPGIYAYSQNLSTVIKIQAMDMARAVLAKDVNKLAGYMPPKLLADAGGIDKMLIARDTLNKFMKQFGAEIKRITIGDPGTIINYKKQLQATLPQTTEVKFMASKVIIESTLIAISEDKGLHWYFIDTSIYHGDKLKSSLPDLSPELIIPPLKQPKILSNEQ